MCAQRATDAEQALESLKRKRAISLSPPPAEMSGKETLPAAQPPSKKSVAIMLMEKLHPEVISRGRLPIAEYHDGAVTKNVGGFVTADPQFHPKMKIKLSLTRKAIGTKLLMRESQFQQYHEGEVVAVEQSSSFTEFECKFPTSNPTNIWRLHAHVLEMAQAWLDNNPDKAMK
jgi:hypothetical protein